MVDDLGRNFLASANVLGGDAEIMRAKLYQQVHKLEHNPWFSGASKTSSSVAPTNTHSSADTSWADSKVKKVITDTAKSISHASSVENSRANTLQVGSP